MIFDNHPSNSFFEKNLQIHSAELNLDYTVSNLTSLVQAGKNQFSGKRKFHAEESASI